AAWQRLVESYLEGRAPLRAAVLVQDVRRDASVDELDLVAWLAEREIPMLVAATKADKLKHGAREARLPALRGAYGRRARVLLTSAVTKLGVAGLWERLAGSTETP